MWTTRTTPVDLNNKDDHVSPLRTFYSPSLFTESPRILLFTRHRKKNIFYFKDVVEIILQYTRRRRAAICFSLTMSGQDKMRTKCFLFCFFFLFFSVYRSNRWTYLFYAKCACVRHNWSTITSINGTYCDISIHHYKKKKK